MLPAKNNKGVEGVDNKKYIDVRASEGPLSSGEGRQSFQENISARVLAWNHPIARAPVSEEI